MSRDRDTAAQTGTSGAVLSGRYEVFPDRPLPALSSPRADACEVVDQRSRSRDLFALMCEPELMPRIDIIPQLSRLIRVPIVNPVDAGTVPWPDSGGQRYVVIFERPLGPRVIELGTSRFKPMREDQVVHCVIHAVISPLKELVRRGIRHRAIRADNLFFADSSRMAVVLGECVSAPPGLSQPVAYEPIDAAIARPSARGPGRAADDLYNFGATLALLLSGGEPLTDMSEEEIVAAKIAQGSYATLVGDARVSLPMMEPLRGLLADDPGERWTIDELELWIGGRHLSPMQPTLPERAARSITFAGQEYHTRPALSYALGRNLPEASKTIRSGALETWLRRALGDEESADAIREIAAGAAQSENQLVARSLMVLEPSHPLRYGSVSGRADGIPTSLAIDYADEAYRREIAEIAAAKLPQIYLQSNAGMLPEQVTLMRMFDTMTHFVERSNVGGGVERALYECNRIWPCLSPLIRQEYVTELAELLPALEKAAHRRQLPDDEPMDHHIAAFCAARNKRFHQHISKWLRRTEPLETRRLGMLYVLADVQRSAAATKRFPALMTWLAVLMEPVIESYHARTKRSELKRAVEESTASGKLWVLLEAVDSAEERERDAAGFGAAQKEYRDLAAGIEWLKNGGLSSPQYVFYKSRQASVALSAFSSGLALIALTILHVF